jgi:hypothetical protein
MVDYCWAKRNIEMGTARQTIRLNHVNEHFVDADGNATTLQPLRPCPASYQYESSAIAQPATPAIDTTEYQRIEKGYVRASTSVHQAASMSG